MELLIPSRLNLRESVETAQMIRDAPAEGDLFIDFGQMGMAGPFSLLMISNAISRLRNAKPQLRIHPRNYVNQTFYAHMGFFRNAGFQYGKQPGGAAGSGNYIPIMKEGTGNLMSEYRQTGRPLGELVEEEARCLAEMLCRSRNGDVFKVLTYALREIMRNTYEHSSSPSIEYAAQYWPEKDRVEIAVIDRGIGIFNSLKSNPALPISDERHAIKLALLPGISRNVNPTKPEVVRNVWQNSGFGLFMTQQMCRANGDFFIASGGSGKYLHNEQSRWFTYGFPGTAVRIVFRPSGMGNIDAALKVFEDQAKRIAKANGINIPNASTASRMIALGFDTRELSPE